MKKEAVEKIVNTIESVPSLHIDDLVSLSGIQKRRLYDILPILEVLGYITRDKGHITKVEPVESNGKYDSQSLVINANGAITSVRQLGPQGIRIEQTALGFEVSAE